MRQFFLIISLVLLVSCFDQGDCLVTSTNMVRISLLNKLDGKPKLTVFPRIREVQGSDTVVVYQDSLNSVSSLTLPLNPHQDSSTFLLLRNDSSEFRLSLRYTQYSKVISTTCGAFLYYKNLRITDSSFDSARVTNSELLISVSKNLQVYF